MSSYAQSIFIYGFVFDTNIFYKSPKLRKKNKYFFSQLSIPIKYTKLTENIGTIFVLFISYTLKFC